MSKFQKQKPQYSNTSNQVPRQTSNHNQSQNSNSSKNNNNNIDPAEGTSSATSLITTVNICKTPSQTLLSTAVVKIINENGYELYARALVDQASQASFISQSLYKRLCTSHASAKIPVSGVGGKTD